MREIKFRGKRVDNGDWVYGHYTNLIGKGKMRINNIPNPIFKEMDFNSHLVIKTNSMPRREGWDYNECFSYFKVDPKTVGQFTGLKDKNGVEIYEHDLFREEREENQGDIRIYNVVMWIRQRGAFYLIPIDHYSVLRDNNLEDDPDFEWLFEDALLYDFSVDIGLDKVGNLFDNPELLK